MRGGRSHCKAGHQSNRGHTGLAILRCLSTNMTGIANTDEALTCVKLLISGTPYSFVRELRVLSLVYRWRNGRFGKLNSSSWVAQVVCDGTCAGTQVLCYSPREWSRKSGCRRPCMLCSRVWPSPGVIPWFSNFETPTNLFKGKKGNIKQNVQVT